MKAGLSAANVATYSRVIPRDFFNESKLLKCMGQLSLKVLDNALPAGVEIEIDECGEPFEIRLCSFGGLTVENYHILVNGRSPLFYTSYNSKSNYPLYMMLEDEEVEVFDEDGAFAAEFIDFCKNIEQ